MTYSSIVIVYDNICKEGNLPKLLKSFAHDLSCGQDESQVLLFDYKSYYKTTYSTESYSIELLPEKPPTTIRNCHFLIIPWGSYLRGLIFAIRTKRSGAGISIWSWGLFSKQQHKSNWNNGRTSLFLKKLATMFLRAAWRSIAHGFIVFSESEHQDSYLPREDCTLLPVPRPPTGLMHAINSMSNTEKQYLNCHASYIGRGLWRQKGIQNIATLAKSSAGRNHSFKVYIPSKNNQLEKKIEESGLRNIDIVYQFTGADLLPCLLMSSCFITLNKNPIMLQSSVEALCSGTPVVVFREAMMDSFSKAFEEINIHDSVIITSESMVNDGNVTLPNLPPHSRIKLARAANSIMSTDSYVPWFCKWASNPIYPSNYYEEWATSWKKANNSDQKNSLTPDFH